ncbi:hypothetical protein BDK51DRAFT_34748, partial [Blyttiomyces helicus]
TAELLTQKERWAAREAQLLDQLKASKEEIKELKYASTYVEPLRSIDIEEPKDEKEELLTAKEKRIQELADEKIQLEHLNSALTTRLDESTTLVERLRTANEQLKNMNRTLMEDTESYQVLLQQKPLAVEADMSLDRIPPQKNGSLKESLSGSAGSPAPSGGSLMEEMARSPGGVEMDKAQKRITVTHVLGLSYLPQNSKTKSAASPST